VLKWVLFDAGDVRVLAAHYDYYLVSYLCNVHDRVRVVSVHFEEDQALFAAAHIGIGSWVWTEVSLELAARNFFFLHQLFLVSSSSLLGLHVLLVKKALSHQVVSDFGGAG